MIKKLIRILLGFGIVLAGLFVIFAFYVFADYCLPLGSRSPEERYRFHITETKLIQKIDQFKKENPRFAVPKGMLDTLGTYYHDFLIYYKEKNIVFHFSTRSIPNLPINESEVEFYGVDYLPFSNKNLKFVNVDIKGNENREVKRKFEMEFLDKLSNQYDKNGDSMPIFYDWFH